MARGVKAKLAKRRRQVSTDSASPTSLKEARKADDSTTSESENLGSWVDHFDVDGNLVKRHWIPYPTTCPPNCPGNHNHAERKLLGPPIIGGKRA